METHTEKEKNTDKDTDAPTEKDTNRNPYRELKTQRRDRNTDILEGHFPCNWLVKACSTRCLNFGSGISFWQPDFHSTSEEDEKSSFTMPNNFEPFLTFNLALIFFCVRYSTYDVLVRSMYVSIFIYLNEF